MNPQALLALVSVIGGSDLNECIVVDSWIAGGPSFHRATDGDGWDLSGAVATGMGTDWFSCIDLPGRIEVSLASDAYGAPWGRGVEAVEVARAALDIRLQPGASIPLLSYHGNTAGLDLLAGPVLRVIRLRTRIWETNRILWKTQARATGTFGLFARLGRLRLSLRVEASFPWDCTVGLFAWVGWTW